jgi:glycosyltransferase involved in cell wall biosynthesis
MTGVSGPDRFDGLIVVIDSPSVIRAGGPWVLVERWAEAGRELFGNASVLTPDGALSTPEIEALATRVTRGRAQASRWRRAVPESMVTAANDVRRAQRARHVRSIDLRRFVPGIARPIIVQYHSLFFDAGLRLARALDTPCAVLLDGLQVWEAEQWGVRRPGWGRFLEEHAELRILRRADLVACISEEVAACLRARGFTPERTIVTPNRAAPEFFTDRDRAALRRRFGIPEDAHVVGWAGSFRRFHALDVLLEAFERIAAQDPAAILLLVGDGPERPRAEMLAERLGPDRVRLVGMVPVGEVADYVAVFDVGVIPSRAKDSFHYSPLKLHEFMAAGVPVVAPAVGEIDRDYVSGDGLVLYHCGDVTALARETEALLDDVHRRELLGRAARHTEWSRPGTVESLRNIIETVGR